ncbi:MAG TPA: hypothetical protein VLF43_04685 [Candidatus Saccharimonadales bacterium]|nr:hypothetical protein [Candidatus Saccharimonadales bacterium]
MSDNTVRAPLSQLDSMAKRIERFTDSTTPGGDPYIEWHYSRHPNEQDTVVALTDLIAYEQGERRLLAVSQWLGPAASGDVCYDVRYSVRDLEGGPLIMWRQNPTTTDDLAFWDVHTKRVIPYDLDEAVRIAALLPTAKPIADAAFYPRTLAGRVVNMAMQLPSLLYAHAA